MFRFLIATSASLLLATSASAITLEPGKTYIGDLTIQLSDLNTFPGSGFVYDNIRNLRAQQLNTTIGFDNPQDPGDEFTVSFASGLSVINNTNAFPIFGGAYGFTVDPGPLTFAFTYVVTIVTSATTTPVALDDLVLQSVVDADFTGPNGETGPANLSGITSVLNIREQSGPPVDPQPEVIPLPATAWGLIAGLGVLLAMRRRQRA